MEGVALKWAERKIRFVYVWTLGAQSSMRDYIALGVDGIFVNDVPALKAVLGESAIKQQVALASRDRDPFALPPYLHAYVLTVTTASKTWAGTDADLSFELHGTAGVAKTTIDSSPPFMFEEGNTDRVALIGTNVGTIQKLVIVNHGDSSGDWFLNTVKVHRSGTGLRRHLQLLPDHQVEGVGDPDAGLIHTSGWFPDAHHAFVGVDPDPRCGSRR